MKMGDGIAGRILETGNAELIDAVQGDVRFKAGALKIGSMICVPLTFQSFNFGIITMSSSIEGAFDDQHLQLLGIISSYASIAIQNAFSCSELQGAAEELMNVAGRLGV